MNDIDTILEHGLDALVPSLNTYLLGITSRIIKTESEQCIIPAGQAGYEDIIRFLEQRGELLVRYDSMYMAAARIRGGFLSMNPGLVICSICEGQLWISTYAKEGLIKQHTAEKLLERLRREYEEEFGKYLGLTAD